MKRTHTRNAIIITAILILTGAGIALAHDGWGGRGGYGGHMMGYGGHMMGYSGGYGGSRMGPGFGPGDGELSQDDTNRLAAAREKFYDQTRELREKMEDKGYAIQSELNKEDPDRDKIVSLQGELSQLRSQLDQYALDYNLAVRKIVPDSARVRAYADGYRGGNCW